MKRLLTALFLFTLAPVASASFIPGPIQVNASGGTATAVGYATGGSSVPVSIVGGTVIITTTSVSASTVAVVNAGGVALKVDGSAVTQPVSGSVNVNNLAAGSTVYLVNPTTTTITGGVNINNLAAGSTVYVVNVTTVAGSAAVGSAIAGNPIPFALQVTSATLPTVRASGTAIYGAGSTWGQTFVAGVPEDVKFSTYSTTISSATTGTVGGSGEQVLVSSPPANFYTYLCGCVFTNTTATNGAVHIESPTGTATSRMSIGVPANYVPTGVWPGCTNPFYRSAVASNIYIYQSVASSTQAIYMRCSYYTGP